MKQSKKHSALESVMNVVVGLLISIITQMILYPILKIPVTFSQNLIITFVFFILSFVRGYVIRRIFNNKITKPTEEEIGIELYLELYNEDIVDEFGRIYMFDGVYLRSDGTYEVDDL